MVNFKIKSRHLKLCNEFRAFVRCIKAAFLLTRLSKTLNVLIKRLGRAFVSKNAVEGLNRSPGLLKHLAELFRV